MAALQKPVCQRPCSEQATGFLIAIASAVISELSFDVGLASRLAHACRQSLKVYFLDRGIPVPGSRLGFLLLFSLASLGELPVFVWIVLFQLNRRRCFVEIGRHGLLAMVLVVFLFALVVVLIPAVDCPFNVFPASAEEGFVNIFVTIILCLWSNGFKTLIFDDFDRFFQLSLEHVAFVIVSC